MTKLDEARSRGARQRERTPSSWRQKLLVIAAVFMCGQLAVAEPVHAKRPRVEITELQELRFGEFAVLGTGARTVGTDGSIQDVGLVPMGAANIGPAAFAITYDRGNESNRTITIDVSLAINSGVYSSNGLKAELRELASDLPGFHRIEPGQSMVLTLPDCRQRVCTMTFRIGATMEVTHSSGGGNIVVPTFLEVAVNQVY